jgi:hypothetical protein
MVKSPKMVMILVWALEEISLPENKPRVEPAATVIVLKIVPSNIMHTSYICGIIILILSR